MTAIEPSEENPEAITLSLYDASPDHLAEAMAEDVELAYLERGAGETVLLVPDGRCQPRCSSMRGAAVSPLTLSERDGPIDRVP